MATKPTSISPKNSSSEYAKQFGCEELHIKVDEDTGLQAVIAIHNTNRGPAFGGCRLATYPSFEAGIQDAARLAEAMSYKAALADLNYGGGKAVLIKPKTIPDRQAYFQSFAQFLNELEGRYITIIDMGTDVEGMDLIAKHSPHVAGTTELQGDPSPYTAHGIRLGIEACIKTKLNKTELKGIHVAIQGVGHVGYQLAKELHQFGVSITACDIDEASAQRVEKEFSANIVRPDDIYKVDCDVFSPCAVGGILNSETIAQIKAPIIAGAANNQLEKPEHGLELYKKDILYAPDYVINAGGLIFSSIQFENGSITDINSKIKGIYDWLMTIFELSKETATNFVSDKLAKEKLKN